MKKRFLMVLIVALAILAVSTFSVVSCKTPLADEGEMTMEGTTDEMSTEVDMTEEEMALRRDQAEALLRKACIVISEEEKAREQLRELRAQTLERAQEVISRQMQTAQEIARLLGETTAETKVLLVKVMSLFREEGSQ